MSLRLRPALLLAVAAALLACENRSSGPDSVVRPATLAFYGDSAIIDLPDSAVVGVAITVDVRSYGGGCVSQDQTSFGVEGRAAFVRPFVREPAPTRVIACTDILRQFSHKVDLVFNEPGIATVRVFGVREPGRNSYSVSRTVQVVSAGSN